MSSEADEAPFEDASPILQSILAGELPRAAEYASLSSFGRLGMRARFEIDSSRVEEAHRRLSLKLHPDRHARKSPKEKMTAIALTASLNEAYAKLRDDRQRAEELLQLWGGASASEDKSTPEGFLLRMLELREALEDADSAQAERLRGEIEPARAEAFLLIARELGRGPDASDKPLIRAQLNTLKYYDNLLSEAAEVLSKH